MNTSVTVTKALKPYLTPAKTLVFALSAMALLPGGAFAGAAKGDKNAAVIPAAPRKPFYVQQHEKLNERVKQGNVDLVFIGDSITDFWQKQGKTTWEKYYAKRNAVDLGVAGDRTQHVLWRIEHGNLDGISPKLAVLMIGTNNTSDNLPAEKTAAGVKAIVQAIHSKTPATKVLLLGIFPRGKDSADPKRQLNEKVNELISALNDGTRVTYMDIGAKFLAADGALPKENTLDFVHLKPKGYEIWAQAIEPKVKELMGEK